MTSLERLKSRYPESSLEVLQIETRISVGTLHRLVRAESFAGFSPRTRRRLDVWAQTQAQAEQVTDVATAAAAAPAVLRRKHLKS